LRDGGEGLVENPSAQFDVSDAALEDGWRLFFSRDPNIAICTVRDDGSGQVVVDRVLAAA
jgi:hypothetical protein